MAASNNSPTPVSDSLNRQMANLGVTDQHASADQSRRTYNVKAENVMINAGRTLPGTLAHETLELRMSEARKSFIATDSFQNIQRTLEQFGHVTISGASGEGKTTMSLMLARDYMKKGFQVVFVEKVDAFDFSECISSVHRLFLIVDDIFGTVGLSTDTASLKHIIGSIHTHMQKYKHASDKSRLQTGGINTQNPKQQGEDKLEEQKNQKDIRVVFTSKTYNLKDGISRMQYERMSMFTGHTLVDLTSDKDHCYSDKEKLAMFHKQKSMHSKVKVGDVSQIDLDLESKLFGFPLTCRLFFEFAVSSSSTKDFFKRPLFYLSIELNNILSLKNDQSAALILMLLFEDQLDLTKLELPGVDKTMDEMFQRVTDIVPSVTRQGIATAARHFRGTFFSGGDTVKFAHSSIHDACACAMFAFNPSFVLRYCSLDFLYERLKPGQAEEARTSDHLNFLFVSDKYYDLVTTRFVEEIKQGHFSKTVAHPILKNEQFVQLLIKKIQPLSASGCVANWVHMKDREKGILYWTVQGYSNKLASELEDICKIKFTQGEIKEALDGCVEKNNLILFKSTVSKLEGERQSIFQRLIVMSGESGSWEIAQYLLKGGTTIGATNKNRQNFIHLACKYDRAVLLKSLIGEIGSLVTRKDYLSTVNSVDPDGRNAAMLAALHGSWDCFTLLCVDSKLDVQDIYRDSVIQLAVLHGNRDIVQHILTPTNINSRGRHGWTPVMCAAVKGQLGVFDVLISNNADLTLVDNFGNSVLHLACQGGNRDIVLHVLTPSIINSRGQHGWTPVMYSAVSGQLGVFDVLVSNNADLTLVDDFGNSVLHLACQGGNRDIVLHVLTPTNINSRGMHGWTPVMYAALEGQLGVFDVLVSNNADLTLVYNPGDSVLHLACVGGNRDIVLHILSHYNINSRGEHDWTPVMYAALYGQLSVFDVLVSNNADLTLVENSGDSVLHLACRGGNRDIVLHVLTHYNINSTGDHGWTPVMNAALYGQLGVFDVLVSNNADLTLVDDFGNSVLHLACQGGNRDIALHVLTPTNINSRGLHGWTPVMYAALEGQLGVFDVLVSNNADLTLVSNSGDSVLHLACRGGNRDIVLHVLTPSNINSRGKPYTTPIIEAAYHGHRHIIDLLLDNQADLSLVDNIGLNVVDHAQKGGKTDIADYLKTFSR